MDLARAHPTLKCHVVQVMQEDFGSSDMLLKRLQAIVQELNIDNMVQTAILSFTPPDPTARSSGQHRSLIRSRSPRGPTSPRPASYAMRVGQNVYYFNIRSTDAIYLY